MHALGAAIPVAVRVACALQQRFGAELSFTTSTETVLDEHICALCAEEEDCTDDDTPSTTTTATASSGAEQKLMSTRAVSAIHIIATRPELPKPL